MLLILPCFMHCICQAVNNPLMLLQLVSFNARMFKEIWWFIGRKTLRLGKLLFNLNPLFDLIDLLVRPLYSFCSVLTQNFMSACSSLYWIYSLLPFSENLFDLNSFVSSILFGKIIQAITKWELKYGEAVFDYCSLQSKLRW